MNRRDFLRVGVAVSVAGALPAKALAGIEAPITATEVQGLTAVFAREFSRQVTRRLDMVGAPFMVYYAKSIADVDYEWATLLIDEPNEVDLDRLDGVARLAIARAAGLTY